MLQGVHLLLTYRCTHACDHCFVHGSPHARGTFTRERLADTVEQAAELGTVEWVYFEGGEPFLYYPLLLEGLALARASGFLTGVVTNAYWAESVDDALLWLRPLRDLGVADFSVSDDVLHSGPAEASRAAYALEAAEHLGIPAHAISLPHPTCGTGVKFRGRAADRLVEGRPSLPWEEFTCCPDEDLAAPSRVHIDAHGNVHVCQGLLMGNTSDTRLEALVDAWDPLREPIAGPLIRGGPAALARRLRMEPRAAYASACHLCYAARSSARERLPRHLGPPQVYGG